MTIGTVHAVSIMPSPDENLQNPDNAASNLNENLKSILSGLNKIVADLTTNDDDENFDEIQFQYNSCSYVTDEEFNSLLSPKSEGLSAFHLNISSMSV